MAQFEFDPQRYPIHLGYCCGVCEAYPADRASAVADYARIIERATDFLTRPHDVIARMKTSMLDHAARCWRSVRGTMPTG
jgi:hypothetical protein